MIALVHAGAVDVLTQRPVLGDDGPQHMVSEDAVAASRLPQHPFLSGADLSHRAVGASMTRVDTNFEAMDTHDIEEAVERKPRRFGKKAGPSVVVTEECRALHQGESGIEAPNQDQPYGSVESTGHDGPACRGAGGTEPGKVREESLQPLHCWGRRQLAQVREVGRSDGHEERRRVSRVGFAQEDSAAR